MSTVRSEERVLKSPIVEARGLLGRHWNRQLPVDPGVIATKLGVHVVPVGSASSPWHLSGYYHSFDPVYGGPVIKYNRTDSSVRRRFTVAHELGHHMLGHGQAPREDVPAMFGATVVSPIERAANQFAAELLMPADAVERLVMSGRFGSVEELADAFKVSKVAMNYRLTNLQLSVW